MRNLAISTRVRAERVAVLVDINDAHWHSSCLRVIEYFTRMWGGCGNIIIPTDGKAISLLFWRILECFDPDYLLSYSRTGRDIEIEEPTKFEEAYQRHITASEKQIGGKTDPHAAETIRNNLRQSRLTLFGISAELQNELRDRLAPFFFQHWIVEAGSLGAASVPHHPHTDVLDILPYVDCPNQVLRISDAAPFEPLWWASSFGCINAELQAQLAKRNIEVYSSGSSPDEINLLIRLAVKGYEEIESAAFFTNTSVSAIDKILKSAPFRLSMAGLGDYRSIRHKDWADPTLAVAGGTIEDFSLYYALSRMRTRVAWIPPSVLDEALGPPPPNQAIDAAWHFVNDLATLARGTSQRHPGLKMVSATLTEAQLEQVKTRLSDRAVGHFQPFDVAKPIEVIPVHPVRHYEANDVSVLRSIAVADDGTIPLFETPLPQSFSKVDPSKHRWLTELSISRYHLPRHYELGERLMGGPSFTSNDVRISSSGPTYFCPSFLVLSGASAASSVPRPSIRIPEPLEIFHDVSKPGGLSCAMSDKGFYAESACQKFGGLSPIAQFLRSDSGRSLTAAFLDRTKPKEGEHLKGVLLGDRRYLDLDSLAVAVGGESEAAQMLDRLALASVLYRGFVLQCQYCRLADWLPLADLTDAFTCRRCHRKQVFTHRHWRHPSQPHLYYQLDELVHLGLEHNMHVPLLALDALRRSSEDSFLYVHELAYRETDEKTPPREVDLNCIVDGFLTIGEAKKEDRLGKNDKEDSEAIAKYFELAQRLAAHQIVFATASEQWHVSTVERIEKAFGNGRFKLLLLTRKHLYGDEPVV